MKDLVKALSSGEAAHRAQKNLKAESARWLSYIKLPA